MSELDNYSALLLNADYRPLSTYPLSRMHWTDSVKHTLAGRTIVVAEYERRVHSGRMSMPIPSVVALKQYVNLDRPAPLNKLNLLIRDRLRCAYCGERFESHELTFDHVVPRCRGGRSTWENLVAACRPCNQRKGDRPAGQVGMTMYSRPYRPTLADLNVIGARMQELANIPKTWIDWIYWTSSIEP